ncbi:hypothetical protein WP1_259 [Pseudomonas phage WP1]
MSTAELSTIRAGPGILGTPLFGVGLLAFGSSETIFREKPR